MGTTLNLGLPYPEPTDPVADGAQAIELLAEAIDVSLRRVLFFEVTSLAQYADTSIQWFLHDGFDFDRPSISRITTNTFTSGWVTTVTPTVDVYSNSVADPWRPGNGLGFATAKGYPYNPDQVGPTFLPQSLPSLTAQHRLAAHQAMDWTVRVGIHNGAGAIQWQGGHRTVIERFVAEN